MRTILHISDIHFGRTDEHIVHELIRAARKLSPDVVAVSGDLTQRAKRSEYEHARRFLECLPKPQIVVPGNHDIPMHNVYARFATPLDRYREYITDDLEPFYCDREIAVLGINTARSLTIKGGRVNNSQIGVIEKKLCKDPGHRVRILVTHHPFDLPAEYQSHHLVGRAAQAMAAVGRCGIDLLLAGHFHVSGCGPTAERYSFGRHSAIFVQAGTATSTRERGEANAFNIIRVHRNSVEVEAHTITPSRSFECVTTTEFHRTPTGWARRVAAAATS